MAADIRFEVEKENLLLRDVFERYQDSLPVIIQVTQGHHGDIDVDTFSSGHVMRIHSYTKQQRVAVRDNSGRHFSIPMDYGLKFRILRSSHHVGNAKSLSDIVLKNKLPIKVEMCSPPHGSTLHLRKNIKHVVSFGVLLILEVYHETYLLGNSITDGKLDSEVIVIPIYLRDLLVAKVTGILNKFVTDFIQFKMQLARVADTSINYNIYVGNNDIAVYASTVVSQSTENIYDLIEPQHFIRYQPIIDRQNPPESQNKLYQELHNKLDNRLSRETSSSTVCHTDMTLKQILPHKAQLQSTAGTQVPVPYGKSPKQPLGLSPPKRPPVAPKPQQKSPGDSTSFADKHDGVNAIARASILPQSRVQDANVTKTKGVINSQRHCLTSTFVKGFTIIDITRKLDLLNLGKFKEAFADAQISGDLLLELDEDVLQSDFDLKKHEAIKLMKFARTGYVPH